MRKWVSPALSAIMIGLAGYWALDAEGDRRWGWLLFACLMTMSLMVELVRMRWGGTQQESAFPVWIAPLGFFVMWVGIGFVLPTRHTLLERLTLGAVVAITALAAGLLRRWAKGAVGQPLRYNRAMGGQRIAEQVRRALIAAVLSSCAGGGDDIRHSCPVSRFALTVPKDRVTDVASVTPTGPCGDDVAVFPMSPEFLYFLAQGVGVCRVTVTFTSGEPDFVAEVKITDNPGPDCPGKPTFETTIVAVPESDSKDAGNDGG